MMKVKAYMPKPYKSTISMGVAKRAIKKLITPGVQFSTRKVRL